MLPFIVGGAVVQGLSGIGAAGEMEDAANQAAQIQQNQYRQTRQDFAPYTNVGSQATNALASIYGYSPYDPTQNIKGSPFGQDDWNELSRVWGSIRPAAQFSDINWNATGNPNISDEARNFLSNNWGSIRPAAQLSDVDWFASTGYTPSPQAPAEMAAPDYSEFYKSPDYEFRRSEGMRDIGNYFGARGGAASGNALRALTEYNSNLAAGEFGNYFNRQMGLSGAGQNAAGTVASAGAGASARTGNALMQAGDARASGVNALGGAVAGGLSDYAYGRGQGWWGSDPREKVLRKY